METDANNKITRLRNGLEAISKGSETLTTWALSVLGGSVASLIGSDYLKPIGCVKLLYLIFIPGWALLAASLANAYQLTSSSMASVFTDSEDQLLEIGQAMNQELRRQQRFLLFALLAFGAWITLFLCFWIFSSDAFASEIRNGINEMQL